MANAVAKLPFSGAVQGLAIKLHATATPGTVIHATGVSASQLDEIWLYAINNAGSDVLVTIEWGGTVTPDNTIIVTVPHQVGLVLLVPGLILAGSGAASLTVRGFAALADTITILGFVNRITP